MSLSLLLDLSLLSLKSAMFLLHTGVWVGQRLYYGKPKTTEELLLEKLEEIQKDKETQKHEIHNLQEKLDLLIEDQIN